MTAAADGTDPWGEVIGQPAAVQAVRTALARDELAHAWLLVGPRSVGQKQLSRALGAALNCADPPTPDAGCGRCPSCVRVLRGTHPAVLDLEPDGAAHVVADVREGWIPLASRSLSEGRRRVLRVVAADRMNEAAQNAFLKILEEPPPSVVWVLDAEHDGALLDTVVSRCRRLDLVPWGPAALTARADQLGLPPERRDALVRASGGSPERLEALADAAVAQARDRHLEVLDTLATAGPGVVVPLAKELVAWARSRSAVVKERNAEELARLETEFGVEGGRGWPPRIKQQITRRHERTERQAQRQALDLVLDDLASYLRDLIAVASGAGVDTLVNPDAEVALRRDAARLPIRDAVEALASVAACRAALDRNGSPELHLERLLFRIALPVYAATA
ncbi:MAG: ATP-binding protein [Nitriliruptoraceae bacterium]